MASQSPGSSQSGLAGHTFSWPSLLPSMRYLPSGVMYGAKVNEKS